MKDSKRISAVTLILISELVIMIILSLVVTKTISFTTRKSSMDNMQTITSERAHIIQTYVENSEKILAYYSKADQISALLSDPTNRELQAKAQAYTESFSKDIENLEGIYVSEWNTHVLAHTNPDIVGLVTRKDPEPLKQLQDSMLAAGNDVYDTGIIISPASGRQIVSMYKAVYNEANEPIGLVGLGIFTDSLVSTLNDISISGFDDSFYTMINVNDMKYIFIDDEELIGKPTENKTIRQICANLSKGKGSEEGSFEYKADGTKYVSTYCYMPKYNWLLMIDDTKREVYSLTYLMALYMGIFGIAILGLVILFSFINRKQEKMNQKLANTIVKSNKTKESLYAAMFRDVLTDVRNRIAFSMDFEEVNSTEDHPYYFIMFNISNFSDINSRYGNDTGDWLLTKTVEILGQVFKNSRIYRTGADEFIVSLQINSAEKHTSDILDIAQDAYERLTSPQQTPTMGKVNFGYRAAVARKVGTINTSVITVLKAMLNKDPESQFGRINFTDLSS
jgi:diguanylate cyclase (GGDEF)-like protein